MKDNKQLITTNQENYCKLDENMYMYKHLIELKTQLHLSYSFTYIHTYIHTYICVHAWITVKKYYSVRIYKKTCNVPVTSCIWYVVMMSRSTNRKGQ